MPAKKKKGKGSKLARMSDEERLRYLQHRAELELEAKRRKQQLIAVFTKSKLKREEAFARLNTAKINEQWRFILRQIKCKELYNELDHLWKNFDRTLRAKDAVIKKLYEELKKADLDHRRLQESHMEMIDKLIGRHKKRLESMHENYNLAIRDIKLIEMNKFDNLRVRLANDCNYLEMVIFAQTNCTEEKWMITRTHNATRTCEIEYWKEEEIDLMCKVLGGQMENLWQEMNNVLTFYESSTRIKRKQYEYLKEQDDAMRMEASQFQKLQTNFHSNVEFLRGKEHKLSNERYERIEEFKRQAKLSHEKMWKSRQEMRINQTIDAVQLKRTSVMSASVIKNLTKIEEKGSSMLLLVKMCSNLEPAALAVKKYAIHAAETNEETNTTCVMSPYDKMENFWEQYNHVKAENIHKKRERGQLLMENKRLRQTLRTYLLTLSRIPASRPHTSI